ncbi:hypothetical protein chiPu_0014304 [Chiloscyllium punctatum]|uniref:Uncharacterized protein n=1 Tax=Chiloscyllium punctatum TaxID=137246 RepID=A0A401SZK3_CHIPU|nr:hypothetical protein [Chiloscyllium punctatum]
MLLSAQTESWSFSTIFPRRNAVYLGVSEKIALVVNYLNAELEVSKICGLVRFTTSEMSQSKKPRLPTTKQKPATQCKYAI